MNHVRRYFIWFFAWCITTMAVAQQSLTGQIKDVRTDQPVPNVYVMLMSEDGANILAYAFSTKNGFYTIDYPDEKRQTFLISTSCVGYETFKQKISSRLQVFDIALKESTTPLREVKITSSPIRRQGDTINYYMANFIRPQDRSLVDVLARMPGIEVRKDGQVKYGGKPINRFYIEDMNLLERRYSLATKNLSPSDIATVQVYENHEPIKMMRGRSDPEQAALNIKLKEGARARWLYAIDFGLGAWPPLYNATATSARFAQKNQTLIVGKIDNTGADIFQELKLHSLGARGKVFVLGQDEGASDRFWPIRSSADLFVRDRARFNTSSIVSLNHLRRTAADTDLRLNINYGYEREERERNIETAYHFKKQPPVILRDYTSQAANWHKTESELTFQANKSTYYLEEKLTANVHWKDIAADIKAPRHQMTQQMTLPRIHLRNKTSFSRLIGNVSLGVENETEYTRLPQQLTIESTDTLPLFGVQAVKQSVTFDEAFSHTYATAGYKRRHHTFDLTMGGILTWQRIRSQLTPYPEVAGHYTNDLQWRSGRFYAQPSYRFIYGKWNIRTSFAVNSLHTDYSGRRNRHTYINPHMRVIFDSKSGLKLSAGYSRNVRYGNLDGMETGYMMTRYNTFSRGIDQLQRKATQTIDVDATYKTFSQFMTLNYNMIYSQYNDNLMPVSFIRDMYAFYGQEVRNKTFSSWTNRLSVNKLFTGISLIAGLSLSYNRSGSSIEQQGTNYDYINHSLGIEPSLRWNASPKLNFDYTMDASLSGISVNRQPVPTYIPLVEHRLYTFFGATDKLSFTLNLQHFYNKAPGASSSNLLFADLGILYAFKYLTIGLDWTNLLNRKEHITTRYSTINTVMYTERLRPSEVLISIRFKH